MQVTHAGLLGAEINICVGGRIIRQEYRLLTCYSNHHNNTEDKKKKFVIDRFPQ